MQFKVRERQFSAPFYFECKHFHGKSVPLQSVMYKNNY
ncbi:hypothetical protein M097_3165 [Phocaeicola vulgatus str. 3775 SL(B) 10 (iv)]|uniref:Uncharacterized protein n=1 Tax=Phocaeicola vulgatus str. 3775 SL(B) 10 (iv) TaxID=1339350 RepID=A0A078QZX0_PHOVU|nr:hypothetical protein M098_2276 [Phocaeicola vulgatus str. 3775 SR(B) 19]KDS28635.1 hypothetical protein M097_3165 [Phocaeicola vulgatus str. 3775 SL(B) 10 (iv)]